MSAHKHFRVTTDDIGAATLDCGHIADGVLMMVAVTSPTPDPGTTGLLIQVTPIAHGHRVDLSVDPQTIYESGLTPPQVDSDIWNYVPRGDMTIQLAEAGENAVYDVWLWISPG